MSGFGIFFKTYLLFASFLPLAFPTAANAATSMTCLITGDINALKLNLNFSVPGKEMSTNPSEIKRSESKFQDAFEIFVEWEQKELIAFLGETPKITFQQNDSHNAQIEIVTKSFLQWNALLVAFDSSSLLFVIFGLKRDVAKGFSLLLNGDDVSISYKRLDTLVMITNLTEGRLTLVGEDQCIRVNVPENLAKSVESRVLEYESFQMRFCRFLFEDSEKKDQFENNVGKKLTNLGNNNIGSWISSIKILLDMYNADWMIMINTIRCNIQSDLDALGINAQCEYSGEDKRNGSTKIDGMNEMVQKAFDKFVTSVRKSNEIPESDTPVISMTFPNSTGQGLYLFDIKISTQTLFSWSSILPAISCFPKEQSEKQLTKDLNNVYSDKLFGKTNAYSRNFPFETVFITFNVKTFADVGSNACNEINNKVPDTIRCKSVETKLLTDGKLNIRFCKIGCAKAEEIQAVEYALMNIFRKAKGDEACISLQHENDFVSVYKDLQAKSNRSGGGDKGSAGSSAKKFMYLSYFSIFAMIGINFI